MRKADKAGQQNIKSCSGKADSAFEDIDRAVEFNSLLFSDSHAGAAVSPISIRPAKTYEAKQISTVIIRLASHLLVEPDGVGAEKFLQSITTQAIEQYILSPRYHYLVGELGDDIAGVVAVRGGRHLFHLFVSKPFQHQGVGGALWRAAVEYILSSGIGRSVTVNASLSAFPVYEHFGFRQSGECSIRNGIVFIPMCVSVAKLVSKA